jgi:hypothetical protein
MPVMEPDGIEADSPSFLNCPYFEAAQVTFQGHLYSGWYGKQHSEAIGNYLIGVKGEVDILHGKTTYGMRKNGGKKVMRQLLKLPVLCQVMVSFLSSHSPQATRKWPQ